MSGSKSLEALSEIDESSPPVPTKKNSKADLASGHSPETIRRRMGLGGKLQQRSSSPAGMLRTVLSPQAKYVHQLDLSLELFQG